MVYMYQRRSFRRKILLSVIPSVCIIIISTLISIIPLENLIQIRGYFLRAYLPTTYLWRLSITVFTIWLIIAIIHFLKPMTSSDITLIVLGTFFIIIHYMYLSSLSSEGIEISINLFTYTLTTFKKSLTFLDLGQIVMIVCVWRFLVLFKIYSKSQAK